MKISKLALLAAFHISTAIFASAVGLGEAKPPGDITAAAFGDFYDMSDGALPIKRGGKFTDIVSGDTWYTTWGAADTVYATQDDGQGFNNSGGITARTRLCQLVGNPNTATGSFWGINLNPGILGTSMPHGIATPEYQIGYSSSIYEQDGILYIFRFDWSPGAQLWPPLNGNLTKSLDGGKTWTNHLGEKNVLPDKNHAMFPRLPWSYQTFIQYGKDGSAPNVDNADKFVYLTATSYLARVPRDRLARLDLKDFEYYRGPGFDGMLDSSWSKDPADGKPMACSMPGVSPADAQAEYQRRLHIAAITRLEEQFKINSLFYNFALHRYVASAWSGYFAPADKAYPLAKARLGIYTATHPWGPWQQVMSYGIWGGTFWNMIFPNKFTTSDGLKMWQALCGGYQGNVWNYGLQYTPLYLSTGPVDIYEAEKAELVGAKTGSVYPSFSGSGYVTGLEKTGDAVIFNLQGVSGTGWHIVRIRYTSPKVNGSTLSIYVNGREARRVKTSFNNDDFRPQEDWTDRSDIYYLNNGANTFEIRRDDGDTPDGVMIDYIAVSRDQTHDEGTNVAPSASASASSGDASSAIKGFVDYQHEWAAKGGANEWIQLNWNKTVVGINKIVLYDRANKQDQIVSGELSFSDGSVLPVGNLQNDGQAGTIITFPPKAIRWVRFTIKRVRDGTRSAGLGELQVDAN